MENHHNPLFLRGLSDATCSAKRYRALIVAGRDAASFLQGQLTQDVAQAQTGQLCAAAMLTPQGRVLATPWLAARGESIVLLLPAPLAVPMRDELKRYVLRAQIALSLAEPDAGLIALLGAALAARGAAAQPAPLIAGAAATATAPATADADALWQGALVAAGYPEIGPATSGEWIPQMLNLDLLDAISMTKGCYTGQEIVARTQNLGRIKRRMFRYAAAVAPPEPKAALYTDGRKVGEVVLAAATASGTELLAVVNLDARDAALALADGAACRPAALPYRVP